MNISSINFFNSRIYPKFINNRKTKNINFGNQLNQDTVEIQNKPKTSFQTKDGAYEYYRKIGEKVNAFLDDEDELSAFEILGYDVDSDFKTDKLTINGDFKPYFITYVKGVRRSDIPYRFVGIDENRLLENVAKIKGKAVFYKDNTNVSAIKTKSTQYIEPPKGPNYSERKFIKYHADCLKQVKDIQESYNNNDTTAVLKQMGFISNEDNEGNIEINGDFGFSFVLNIYGFKIRFDFDEIGINPAEMLEKIKKVKGDLITPDAAVRQLKGGMKVDGTVILKQRTNEEDFFSNYISTKNIAKEHKEIPERIIRTYIKYGLLKPDIKTKRNFYFNSIDGENKLLLDNLIARKDVLLTAEELQERYKLSPDSICKAYHEGTIKPYLLEEMNTANAGYKEFLYDISDKNNAEGLIQLEKIEAEKPKRKSANKFFISRPKFITTCLKQSVQNDFKNIDYSLYPIEYLQRAGFGTKADLFATCLLETNSDKLRQYFANNDHYDLTNPKIANIVFNSRYLNPSFISLEELQTKLIRDKNAIVKGIFHGKLNVIMKNITPPISLSEICFDISDKENLNYLKSIDDKSFQNWLSETLKKKEEYSTKNQKKLEDFIAQ